jgi:hypothetical protein
MWYSVSMKTTGIFKVASYRIDLPNLSTPLYIAPLGDIHYGAVNHAAGHFHDHLAELAELGDSCYILGMGDYLDLFSAAERAKVSELHETTSEYLARHAQEQADEFADILEPWRGRIIGLIEGNHHGVLQIGNVTQTSTEYLAHKLGANYLGVMSVINLDIRVSTSRTNLVVCAHHGVGASRYAGASLRKVEQQAECVEADIYLMGHDHAESHAADVRLRLVNGKAGPVLVERPIRVMRTGGFQKSYENNKSSWLVDKAAKPRPLGAPIIQVNLSRDEEQGKRMLRKRMRVLA